MALNVGKIYFGGTMKRLLFVSLHLVLLSLVVSACASVATDVFPAPESPARTAKPEGLLHYQ
jgi:hypothetical protein